MYGRAGNSKLLNISILSFISTLVNVPRQCGINMGPLKCKETELDLSQNETAKQLKGSKVQSHAQEEAERSVKVLGKH